MELVEPDRRWRFEKLSADAGPDQGDVAERRSLIMLNNAGNFVITCLPGCLPHAAFARPQPCRPGQLSGSSSGVCGNGGALGSADQAEQERMRGLSQDL